MSTVLACIEIGGSGVQTVVFDGETHHFSNGVAVPADAVVGIATPGHVDAGRVATASTFGWTNVDPAEQLGLAAAATIVCNDAEAAALGEWVLRGACDAALVYVGVGTGIGGAVVEGGEITRGNLFGHQPGFGTRRCACGRTGCLETVAAGWALPRPLGHDAVVAAAASIARAIDAEPAAAAGVIVVGGGVAGRYPALVEHLRRVLVHRDVVASAPPPGAKSAAAWGIRALLRRRQSQHVDLRVFAHPAACAAAAADLIERAVASRGEPVLGVATGSTPVATYHELARRGVDLTSSWIYLLDEYVGLPTDDPHRYLSIVRTVFGELFGVDASRIRAPDADAGDLVAAGARFDAEIAERGGIDVQLLGIGRNGHIGFNEPGAPLDAGTHPVTLAETTRADNARFFDSAAQVPYRAVTQGIATILRARSLVLLATGQAKAAALAAALTGPVTSAVPASALQLHARATVLADRPAAADLPDRAVDLPGTR